VQVFHFMEGRWHLTDMKEKYYEFKTAVGDRKLAERLFAVSLNLAEGRRGGLFVLLDRPESVRDLVAPQDLLENGLSEASNKAQVYYLLRQKHVLELEMSVLQSIARVDGGIVMDRVGRLLAFGAILRNTGASLAAQDGGRTTAAVQASRFGLAVKISEDGMVSFYRGRRAGLGDLKGGAGGGNLDGLCCRSVCLVQLTCTGLTRIYPPNDT